MTLWKDITTAQRLSAIMAAYPTIQVSARNLAAAIGVQYEGVTRNAIMGFYVRHAASLRDFPLQISNADRATLRARTTQRSEKAIPVEKQRPPAVRQTTEPKPEFRYSPLVDVRDVGECKWPVDGSGIAARFCCAEVNGVGSYCAYHAELSVAKRAA